MLFDDVIYQTWNGHGLPYRDVFSKVKSENVGYRLSSPELVFCTDF